ncbi:MAG: Mur ligase family protein, partial [Janthinobacterium lividum]
MKYELERIFKQHAITGICYNSKEIKSGQAFFAIAGTKLDGNDFIEEALANGAKIVVSDSKLYIYNKEKNSQIPNGLIIYVDDIRAALSQAASILYPNLPNNLIAVTGTNGKTSVVAYCKQLLALLNQRSASVGTLGVDCSDIGVNKLFEDKTYKTLTTPDIVSFRRLMNSLANNNIDYTIFEASIHGLAQNRL